MQHIFEATKDFPLDNLVLATPIVISSGIYFIKYLLNNEAVYIQTPKCITRQGIMKGGKKMYCDLLFTNENDSFIKWIEELENYSFSYIYKCRERWFDIELELDDISNSFISILKIFKSGKYYVLRTTVPGNADDCLLNLYDESENPVDHSMLSELTNVIPILEFKGIKCTSRNFQVEIEIKQMMIIKPTVMFEKCVIRNIEPLGNVQKVKNENSNHTMVKSNNENSEIDDDVGIDNENVKSSDEVKKDDEIEIVQDNSRSSEYKVKTDDKHVPQQSNGDLLEVDLEIDSDEIITLTTRNEVYYKIYQEAVNKAKEAKKEAIKSYLEAKQIKNLYMLDDITDNNEELKSVLNIK
jgi:ribosomal 50S subunit-recycling heat shock protein